MNNAPSPWTSERIKMLRKMWPDHVANDIAYVLGGNITRNAVIGKAGRLKLGKKPNPCKQPEWGDHVRFIRMWNGGVAITHMEFTFKCSRATILRHVHKLGLKQRVPWVKPKREGVLKKTIYHPVPSPDKPLVTVPQFGTSCRCGNAAVPGIRVCYACGTGEVHA